MKIELTTEEFIELFLYLHRGPSSLYNVFLEMKGTINEVLQTLDKADRKQQFESWSLDQEKKIDQLQNEESTVGDMSEVHLMDDGEESGKQAYPRRTLKKRIRRRSKQ